MDKLRSQLSEMVHALLIKSRSRKKKEEKEEEGVVVVEVI